jgi:hypothetical protein
MPADDISVVRNDKDRARTICSEGLDCSSRAKRAGVCNAHDGDQDDSIENRREDLDASKPNCNDKRRMTRRGAFVTVQGAVLRYNQTNEEKVDNVEDGDTPDDLLRGPRNLLLGVLGFRGSQPSQFGASVGERRSDEDAAEAVEAIEECFVRRMPVSIHQPRFAGSQPGV